MGGMYGVSLVPDNGMETRRKFFLDSMEKQGNTSSLLTKPEDT